MAQQSALLSDLARTDALLCLEMYVHGRALHHITKRDGDFKEVEQLFLAGWLHPNKPTPKVVSIFRLLSPSKSIGEYAAYRYQVATKRGVETNTVERLLFHGTDRYCMLGETKDSIVLCKRPECSLCRIIADSYDIGHAGAKNKFQRFGRGIYTTACSSKADDYARNISLNSGSDFRFTLLNRVVVGKEMNVHHHRHRMLNKDKYDSLRGIPGAELNYEETVVYTNSAILPAYLVVYGDGQTLKKHQSFGNALKSLFNVPLVA